MVIKIILLLLIIELVLRLYKKNIISLDVTNYPFYTLAKNKKGKYPYYIERLGKKSAPVIKTYSEGIRGNIKKTKNPIICIGCSFTEGAAHKDRETYPGKLQQLLKQPVINAGIGGYGNFQMKHMIEKLIKYKPKIVLVQLLDFRRIPLNHKKMKRGRKEFLFRKRIKKISILLWCLLKLNPNKLNSVTTSYMNRNIPKEKLWNLNKKYLDGIQETCKKNNVNLVMFVWPSNNPKVQDNTFFNKKIKEYCQKNKTHSFDARKIYSYYQNKDLQLKGDAHPSALANKLIAKVTYHYLIKEKLV